MKVIKLLFGDDAAGRCCLLARGSRDRSGRRTSRKMRPWRGRRSRRCRDRRRSRSCRPSARGLSRASSRRFCRRPRALAGPSARRPRSPWRPRVAGCRSPVFSPSIVTIRSHPSMMSGAACIIRCPSTTRRPCWLNWLFPRNGSSTEACASLNWRNSGSLVIAAHHQQDPGAGTRRCRHRRPSERHARTGSSRAGCAGRAAACACTCGSCAARRPPSAPARHSGARPRSA